VSPSLYKSDRIRWLRKSESLDEKLRLRQRKPTIFNRIRREYGEGRDFNSKAGSQICCQKLEDGELSFQAFQITALRGGVLETSLAIGTASPLRDARAPTIGNASPLRASRAPCEAQSPAESNKVENVKDIKATMSQVVA
jgi:hypothetical protein